MRANSSTIRPLYSGELARLSGVSTDTLRFYERNHLLPTAPRSSSGYRLFPPEALARVRLIQSSLSMGFSVKDLAGIFCEREHGGAPCRRVRELAAQKLMALESRLKEMRSWRRELRATLAEWDRLLAKTPSGKQARLLETFVSTHPKRHTRRSPLRSLAHGNKRGENQ